MPAPGPPRSAPLPGREEAVAALAPASPVKGGGDRSAKWRRPPPRGAAPGEQPEPPREIAGRR